MLNRLLHTARDTGTSLIELLVYMALVTIGLTAVYSVLVTNLKTYDSIENSQVMHQDLRSSITMMTKEVRRAGCNPEDAGGVGFQTDADDRYNTDGNSIHFTADLSPLNGEADGRVTGISEDVGYYLEGDTLFRRAVYADGAALEAQKLVENIKDFQLTYFERDGTQTADPPADLGDIWFVNILIEGNTKRLDRITGQIKTEIVESRVRVRNQGTN